MKTVIQEKILQAKEIIKNADAIVIRVYSIVV